MLAGCGGSQLPIGAAGAMPRTSAIVKYAGGRSWMLPEATSENLLYIANDNGTVTVYSYPQGKMVGILLGFDVPEGECVDSAGDVFITVFDLQQIIEYAHAGTKPIATLKDSGHYPWSCSVDPTTGNLAVSDDNGTIAVYAKAKGTPKELSTNIMSLWCAYDNKGNLFANGNNDTGVPALTEFQKGGSGFEPVNLYPDGDGYGGVQWDGKYLAIGDGGMDVYRFAIADGKGTEKAELTLIGSTTTVFWIQGSTIAALNDHANIGIWKYPAGGYPTKIVYRDVVYPNGVTISAAKQLRTAKHFKLDKA
jgi:WD40 repeat protein